MSEEEETCTNPWRFALIICLMILTTGGGGVDGESLETDRDVLLSLKSFFEQTNRVNRGRYSEWNLTSANPCQWPGILCTSDNSRVNGINLTDNDIAGDLFRNFSALTELSYLDLSENTLGGDFSTYDLSRCRNLKYLNLSHNIIEGELNLSGLDNLEVLDLSRNRINGGLQTSFPAICGKLLVANLSENNFTGSIDTCFEECWNLQYLDLSSNNFSGEIWPGFQRLRQISVSDNKLSGIISPSFFLAGSCNLDTLDLSENRFDGEFPGEVSNCGSLSILNLYGNNFTGEIPSKFGLLSSLEALYLGSNNFSRKIPDSLLNCTNLVFLDLCRNNFGGDIQETIGLFTQVKFLVLHGNSYTGGFISSGILKLPNIIRLDLSFNNFSGPLPIEISKMLSLKFLILAYNQFNGTIPPEYGNMVNLQALDLSFNRLTGTIPSSIGNLSSMLWLMLANNLLTGEIPPEIGNCTSLLWLNLANNQFSGKIPTELTTIGRNATSTFRANRQVINRVVAGSGECLAMRRWIPADYPPFSFVYILLTRRSCRNIWDNLLKGTGIFPVCSPGSSVRTFQISGYLQLSDNHFSGEVPAEIGNMVNFSMLHLGVNNFNGHLPSQIGQIPLVVLNISENGFSGTIPMEIGNSKCLQSLDFSYNNFSGDFPTSLNNLSELSNFNISYNPYITGVIPSTGQLATFEKSSYLGVPHLRLPSFIDNSTDSISSANSDVSPKKPTKLAAALVFFALVLAFLVCGILSLIVCVLVKSPIDSQGYLLESTSYRHDLATSSNLSSPWLSDTVKVIRLDKTAFTYSDILRATANLSNDRIIGKGGSGIVYKGVLPDGREVAVKKIQREGVEGEREYRAEMEVLSGNGLGWPHPNLVTLYGWCLDESEKLLVYEYMEGGSLEDLVSDRTSLTWRKRVEIAIDVAQALVFLHHECFPAIVHRDVKASNVLLDKNGNARVTDFGLARVVDAGDTHVSTIVAGTVGYVAPEYGQTWHATTKGDVYSFGVLVMELATGRRAVDGGEEGLVEWARRVMGNGRSGLSGAVVIPVVLLGSGLAKGADEMCELLRIGIKCTAESPQARPNMKEVLVMLNDIMPSRKHSSKHGSSPPPL